MVRFTCREYKDNRDFNGAEILMTRDHWEVHSVLIVPQGQYGYCLVVVWKQQVNTPITGQSWQG